VKLLSANTPIVHANGSKFHNMRIDGPLISGPWYNASWAHREAITIQASKIDNDLTNFPVYVNLADLGSSFFSSVKGDGSDIRVTEGDAVTELPYELVKISTSTQTGELYFKANSISSSTNTTFYIYYGNAAASAYAPTATYGSQNVWTNGYVLVEHMNDLTTSSVQNSVGSGLNGTKTSANNPLYNSSGRIGGDQAIVSHTVVYLAVRTNLTSRPGSNLPT
jgi:hypothetical protein